jgi:threonylcarbamoyladenosine tRNA methylthiotransferase MtaB
VRLLDARAAPRIRLSSIEPWSVDDKLLGLLSGGRDALARHLHVPLQSASPRILEAMGRPGSPGVWLEVVSAAARSGLAVGTDVLVGFPGEEEEDFGRTLGALEASGCAYLHAFSYSPRPGTAACSMAGRPAGAEVRRRVGLARAASTRMRRSFLGALVGSSVEVVVERRLRSGPGCVGTSSEFARTIVEGAGAEHVGRTVRARALAVEDERLVARLEEVVE